MQEKWFYVNASGDVVGPIAVSVLKKLVEEGVVGPSTILISEDGTREFEAGKVSLFFKGNGATSSAKKSDFESADSPATRSLTPLPSAKTMPLAPKQAIPKTTLPSPPAPEMPLISSNPFDSGVPVPVVLKSTGERIIRPKHGSWKDNALIWTVVGLGFLFLFGSLLVSFTWKMAVQHVAEMSERLPKYEGKAEQKTLHEDGTESTEYVANHPRTPEELMAMAEKSIAQISGPVSCGTGFVVAPGVVATNSHVIASEKIEQLEIFFPALKNSLRGPHKPKLLYEDTVRDIALLGIETGEISSLPIIEDYLFRRAQRIMTIGNPGRGDGVVLENAVSAGILSTQTKVDGLPFYQLSIAVNAGNSGGPVLDEEGRVIGMITLKSVKSPSMAFCIPSNDLEHAMQLEKNLTAKERSDMNAAHVAVVGLRRGLERLAYESVFGDEETADSRRAGIDDVESELRRRSDSEYVLAESSQQRNPGAPAGTMWGESSAEIIRNVEPSLSQLSEEERENLMHSHRERRYRQILSKEKWTFNGTPLYGKIVGFKEGIVLIQQKDSAAEEAPLERYARRFSASDINDILFYARYHGIPTGNLGRR